MREPETLISLRDAERVVDALNQAMDFDGTVDERAQHLLQMLVDLHEQPVYVAFFLLEELERKPAPLVRKRFFCSPTAASPAYSEHELQVVAEGEWRPLLEHVVPGMLDRIQVPLTLVTSEVFGETAWFTEFLVPFMREHHVVDLMFSAWAASPDRAILVNVVRAEPEPPFTEADQILASLLLRAVAPFVDREIFVAHDPLSDYDLTERQKEVLAQLLKGQSPKEIAAILHRSVHTIHHFVQQLYGRFDVSSRGELMAVFVDKAVMRAVTEGQSA